MSKNEDTALQWMLDMRRFAESLIEHHDGLMSLLDSGIMKQTLIPVEELARLRERQILPGQVRSIKVACYCHGKGTDDPKHFCNICQNTGFRLEEVK